MKSVIKVDSNCIDIGCHKGEILDDIIKHSPKGIHFGFEPIPILYNQLKKKYENKATILPDALSDKVGNSTFQFVKNAPAYSGIKRRDYDVDNPEIEEITVTLNTLDKVLPKDLNIDFIKIDVEGYENQVVLGAKETLIRNKPIIIVEQKGFSDRFNESQFEAIETLKGYGAKVIDQVVKDYILSW